MTENYLDDQLKKSHKELVHEAHANQFMENFLISLLKRIEVLENKLEEFSS